MAHDVFISYASKDKIVADAVCAALEAGHIRCYIAPRDVLPGQRYAHALVDAIHAAKVFVLVFSAASNASLQVEREVDRAVSCGLPVLPLRVEDVMPCDWLEYYLAGQHWLDAVTPPLADHLARLSEAITVLLQPPAKGAHSLLKDEWREFKPEAARPPVAPSPVTEKPPEVVKPPVAPTPVVPPPVTEKPPEAVKPPVAPTPVAPPPVTEKPPEVVKPPVAPTPVVPPPVTEKPPEAVRPPVVPPPVTEKPPEAVRPPVAPPPVAPPPVAAKPPEAVKPPVAPPPVTRTPPTVVRPPAASRPAPAAPAPAAPPPGSVAAPKPITTAKHAAKPGRRPALIAAAVVGASWLVVLIAVELLVR